MVIGITYHHNMWGNFHVMFFEFTFGVIQYTLQNFRPSGLKCQNATPTVFHLMPTIHIMRDCLPCMEEYRLLFFFAIGQVLKILWNFEILTCQSMRKS